MATTFTRDTTKFNFGDGVGGTESRNVSAIVGKSHSTGSATLTIYTTGSDWVTIHTDEAERDAAIDTYLEVFND